MYGLTSRGEAGHQVVAAWLFHLTPYDGEVFDDNWEPAFHKEPSINALKALLEIVKTGPPGIPTFAVGSMIDAFLLGNAAMYLDATSICSMVNNPKISKVQGKVAYALHPKAVKHSMETGGFGIGIPANSTKKEAAFLFLQWMSSQEGRPEDRRSGRDAQPPIDPRGPGDAETIPRVQGHSENLKYANPDWRPIIPEWPEISMQHLGTAVHEVITGKKTPEKSMNEIREPVRKIMEKAGYYSWKK